MAKILNLSQVWDKMPKSIVDIVKQMSLHVWPSIRIGLVVGVLVALYTLTIPNQYRSESKVMPAESKGSGGGMAASAAAAAGISVPGYEGPDAIFLDILNSRTLREALLQTTFHFKVRNRFGGVSQRHETLYTYLDTTNIEKALRVLKGKISVTRDIKSKMLTVSAVTTSPELSQQVVNRLVALLNEFLITKSQTRGGLKAKFSEKRLEESRKALDDAESAYRIFLDGNRNYLISPDPSIRLKGLRLDNDLKLHTQLVGTLTIGREQALLEEKNDIPILNILDEGNLPIEKSSPARFISVLLSVAIVSLSAFAWMQRNWIQAWLGPSS